MLLTWRKWDIMKVKLSTIIMMNNSQFICVIVAVVGVCRSLSVSPTTAIKVNVIHSFPTFSISIKYS